eukprot:COSAG01_NODE_7008_length_3394_cov_3.696813_4_plen_88_part_00
MPRRKSVSFAPPPEEESDGVPSAMDGMGGGTSSAGGASSSRCSLSRCEPGLALLAGRVCVALLMTEIRLYHACYCQRIHIERLSACD